MPSGPSLSESLSRRHCLLLGLGAVLSGPSTAQNPTDALQAVLQRRSDGWWLSGKVPLELSSAMEEVLQKGVPLHFVWQAEWVQSRWYWWDKTLFKLVRALRLAYQPLTRRWRVSQSPEAGGSGAVLHQNFDTLAEALERVASVSGWRLPGPHPGPAGLGQRVELSFALDVAQLPRPFQLGLLNQSAWDVSFRRSLVVPERPVPESESGAGEWRSGVES